MTLTERSDYVGHFRTERKNVKRFQEPSPLRVSKWLQALKATILRIDAAAIFVPREN